MLSPQTSNRARYYMIGYKLFVSSDYHLLLRPRRATQKYHTYSRKSHSRKVQIVCWFLAFLLNAVAMHLLASSRLVW